MPRKKSAAKKAREAAAREAARNAENSDKQPVKEDLTQLETKNEPDSGSDSQSGSDSSSESEIEDEVGDLVTEEIEHGIQEVMNAIRSNDTKKLLDPSVRFFSDPDAVPATNDYDDKKKTRNEKPLYLKDYHRMNLLSGTAYQDDDDEGKEEEEGVTIRTIDGKPSFVEIQKKEKEEILKEIQDAFNDTEKTGSKSGTGKDGNDGDNNNSDTDDNDDFLRKKEVSKSTRSKPLTGNHTGSIPLPEATEENTDEFLQAYLDSQAWIPKPGDKMQLQPTNDSNLGDNDGVDGEGEEEEDDEEFDRAAENFENAYNFRYEDPNAAEIISYARNLATLRRSATSSRRRKRDEAKQVREAEKKEKEQEIQKRKTKTVNELSDLLERLKEEYGTELDEKMVERVASKLLNSDYAEDQWDSVLAELFDDEFYGGQGSEKPSWDDVEDYEEEEEEEEDGNNNDENDQEEPPRKKSKKQTLKEEKMRKRKEKQKLVNLVDKAVERNKLSIIEKVEKERGRSREKDEVKFRYREVSPESYGLTARDIFAAEDADLNEFISLKKFAPYRPQELKKKDKRKVTKPKRIAEWRKKVFHNENGPQFEEETGNLLIGTSENADVSSKKHHRHRHKDHKRGHRRTKIDK